MTGFQKPPPLRVSCTDSDCDNGLHCFKFHKKKMNETQRGSCRSCGAQLVDWNRVHRRDCKDAAYTFEALQHEYIRHHCWHITIDEKAVLHARRKGMRELMAAARHRLEKYVAPADPARDGRQTPFEGNSIFYAQHATACCCRTCLEYWHDIPKGRTLTSAEIDYCHQLVTLYLRQRLPHLREEPEKIPRRRSVASMTVYANG